VIRTLILLLILASPCHAFSPAFLGAIAGGVSCEEPPTTPTILATGGEDVIVISLVSGGAGATSFDINMGGEPGIPLATYSGVQLPYTDEVGPGTTLYYTAIAKNACGDSASSAEVFATSDP